MITVKTAELPSPEARAVHLVCRPDGLPKEDDFAFVDLPLPPLGEGQILVENIFLSVDPYMREFMDAVWPLDTPLEGRAIGRVLKSRHANVPGGALMFHRAGWRTHAVIDGTDARVLPPHAGLSPSVFLAALGGTGLTAYVGLKHIAGLKGGETVFISSAAGGVGSMAGQIARLLGAKRVIGSAGSEEKVSFLIDEIRFDAAFNYKADDIRTLLRRAAPDGIDVYFDNVGGAHQEAAIDVLNDGGRIAWCGAIAQYNSPDPPSTPRNLFDIVGKSLTVRGFLVRNFRHLQGEFEAFLQPHLQAGDIRSVEAVTRGFDHIVSGFIGMLEGHNVGKSMIEV